MDDISCIEDENGSHSGSKKQLRYMNSRNQICFDVGRKAVERHACSYMFGENSNCMFGENSSYMLGEDSSKNEKSTSVSGRT